MVSEVEPVTESAVELAREALYRFLAAALRGPYAPGWAQLLDPSNQQLACAAADLLRSEAEADPLPAGFGEGPLELLTLAPVCAALQDSPEELRAAYDRVFGLVTLRECPPYETEYHRTEEPFFRAQQMADVAGFYRAFGLAPAHTQPERPDHIALELEFMAFLALKRRQALTAGAGDAAEVCGAAQRTFFRDHLAWWAPAFASGLRRKAGGGLYFYVGQILSALLPAERARFGVAAPRSPAVPLPEAREEADAEECAGCAASA